MPSKDEIKAAIEVSDDILSQYRPGCGYGATSKRLAVEVLKAAEKVRKTEKEKQTNEKL